MYYQENKAMTGYDFCIDKLMHSRDFLFDPPIDAPHWIPCGSMYVVDDHSPLALHLTLRELS